MTVDAAIAACADYTPARCRAALEEVLAPLSGLDWVYPGMRVAIKANLVAFAKPEAAVTTHPALLAALSVVLSAIIGIVCGVVAATKQYSIFDNLATAVSLVGVSMPSFWLALMLCLLFAVQLGWLPVSGSYSWEYWVLPVVTLGTSGAANIMRMTRSSMLEVIRMDYIRTARAKGQSERKVIAHHALKNALIPVVTVIGIQFGNLLGGSVLTESVFAIPGLGKYGVDAIKQRDLPAVLGSVLFLAITFSFVNLLTDILYSFIDPHIQTSMGASRRQKRLGTRKTEEEAA